MQLADSNPGEMNPPLVMLHMEPKMDFIPEDVDYIAPLYKTGLRAGTLSTTGTWNQTPNTPHKRTQLPISYTNKKKPIIPPTHTPLLITLILFCYPTYSTPCYPHPTSFSPLSLTSPPLVTLSTTCLFIIIMRLLRCKMCKINALNQFKYQGRQSDSLILGILAKMTVDECAALNNLYTSFLFKGSCQILKCILLKLSVKYTMLLLSPSLLSLFPLVLQDVVEAVILNRFHS